MHEHWKPALLRRQPSHHGRNARDCVDLIYLDPPFNSNKNYNLMYRDMTGRPVSEQIEAFCDTWEMDAEKEELAKKMPILMREHGIEDYYVDFWRLWIQALRNTQPRLLAYLIYMVQRLMQMKIILKPTGSLYLHCDPTSSHYIKIMIDAVFGHKYFQSEIIWKRTSSHNRAKRWGPVHDVLLFYTKGSKYTWNRILQPYTEKYLNDFYRNQDSRGRYRLSDLTGPGTRDGDSGQPWKSIDPTDTGRHWEPPHDRALPIWFKKSKDWSNLSVRERLDIIDEGGLIQWPGKKGGKPQFKRYLQSDGGVPVQDIVSDIRPVTSNDRLGYPTQKPVSLLRRIIEVSSNEGDVVFDPFCGCGTTIYAANELKRMWVGCDIAILATRLVTKELEDRYSLKETKDFQVSGIPVTVEQAEDLFQRDPFQFQHWFVEYVEGFPSSRKTADRGVDGRIYFRLAGDELREIILQVKGGAIRPADIRDLRGALEREDNAEMAALSVSQRTDKGHERRSGGGRDIRVPRRELSTHSASNGGGRS